MVDFKHNLIGVFSDIHIGLGQDSTVWHECVIEFAQWVKSLYKSKNIKDIVIPGDIFHNRSEISVNTLSVAKTFFEILSEFNIYILVGNHDCYYKDRSDINSISLLNYWNNINIIDKNVVTIEYKDKKISFVPWATPLKDMPKSDICFGHFEINSFHMNAYKICEHGFDSEDLLTKSPFIISGHFHKKSFKKYTNGVVYYLGSPYQQNFGDCGEDRGVYTLNLDDFELKFYENDKSPKHIKISIKKLIEGKIDANFLKQNIPSNIVSLIIDENLSSEKILLISSKIQNLKPKSFRTDYKLEDNLLSDHPHQDYSSIDITKSMEDFISTLDVQYKEDVVNYLNQLYNNLHK
jgi:DNA repair exonuclease SbcCD nuclease subunit